MNPISNEEVKALGASFKGKTVYLIADHNEFPAGTAFIVKASMPMPSRLTYKFLLTLVPEDPSVGVEKIALDNGAVSLSRDGAAPVPVAPPAAVAKPEVVVTPTVVPSQAPAAAAKPPSEVEFALSIPDDPEMEVAARFLEKAPAHRLSQVFFEAYEGISGPFDTDALDALESEYGVSGKDAWALQDVARMYFGYCKANGIAPDNLLYEVNKALEAQKDGAAAEKPKGKGGRPPGSKNKPKDAEAAQPEFRAAEPAQVVQFPTQAQAATFAEAAPSTAPLGMPEVALRAAPVVTALLQAAAGGGVTYEELAAAAVAMAKAAFSAVAR